MTIRRYEFRVDGRLPARAGEVLGDMAVEEVHPGAVLRGDVVDDAHLHGILDQLRALGLVVVRAEPVALPEHGGGR